MSELARFSQSLPEVPRLGIATRGNTSLSGDDFDYAFSRGVRYFNWCGKPDGLSQAVSELGSRRDEVVFAAQVKARTAEQAKREMEWILEHTRSERLEVATLYYVESVDEWEAITADGGAWEVLDRYRRDGRLGLLGLTSHQRSLAAGWAGEIAPDGRRRLDMLMIRYNAAHTGAEREVFPVTSKLGMPVVTFTGLRWRDLLRSTPDDPPNLPPPNAAECYRFCMQHPAVSVALAAPNGRAELVEALRALDHRAEFDEAWMDRVRAHGERVRRHAREFW